MDQSKLAKRRQQNKKAQKVYKNRLKTTSGRKGDVLRKMQKRRKKKSNEKYWLHQVLKCPKKKLRKIRKLLIDIDWDKCIESLEKDTDDTDSILYLKNTSYLNNKKQRNFLKMYVFEFNCCKGKCFNCWFA